MNIELKLTVEDLNARYAQAIDDDKLEAWPDFFTEQGRYRVTTAENFERGLPLGMIYATSRHAARPRVLAARGQRLRSAALPPRDRGAAHRARRGQSRTGADELHRCPHHA